jgi:hypothetical protein
VGNGGCGSRTGSESQESEGEVAQAELHQEISEIRRRWRQNGLGEML